MIDSQDVTDKAIALTFDTVSNVQHVASDVALTISDTYRLKPLLFWGIVGTVFAAVVVAVVASRR